MKAAVTLLLSLACLSAHAQNCEDGQPPVWRKGQSPHSGPHTMAVGSNNATAWMDCGPKRGTGPATAMEAVTGHYTPYMPTVPATEAPAEPIAMSERDMKRCTQDRYDLARYQSSGSMIFLQCGHKATGLWVHMGPASPSRPVQRQAPKP